MNAENLKKLMGWHEKNKRNLPWRQTRDKYLILISEILLKKTDALKVSAVYPAFISKFDCLKKLADADVRSLEEALKPLGLYRTRAHLLKKCAELMFSKFGGKIPENEEELLNLPGVGKYSARAVLCFSLGKSVGLIDPNTLRIFERFYFFKSEKKRARTDKKAWKLADKIVPRENARGFNYALLDLAHAICRIKNPKCSNCPIKEGCRYYLTRVAEQTS